VDDHLTAVSPGGQSNTLTVLDRWLSNILFRSGNCMWLFSINFQLVCTFTKNKYIKMVELWFSSCLHFNVLNGTIWPSNPTTQFCSIGQSNMPSSIFKQGSTYQRLSTYFGFGPTSRNVATTIFQWITNWII
jgi:hypothetical protein